MTVYLDLVVLLNFLVDTLLLLGTNRLAGYPVAWKRAALAGVLGGVYAGCCILPGFYFLGNLFWRTVSLAAMAVIAFGWNRSAMRRAVIFFLLSMALGGLAQGLHSGSFASLMFATAGLVLLCMVGVQIPLGTQKFQPVELIWQGQRLHLTALVDTGNTLRDPISGGSVLVVGADVALRLGISQTLVQDPITALSREMLPGARLIPYRAVGQPGGMLLGLRFEKVRLNGREISPLVAFAPQKIGSSEVYQALAGGV